MISGEFIRSLPKSDLHTHLDGSLRLSTLIELAHEQGVELPSYSESGMRELVFKRSYRDLGEYLTGFHYTCAVLRNPEAVERVAYEMAQDAIASGVRYLEPRFAPQLLVATGEECVSVFRWVAAGMSRAAAEHNNSELVVQGGDIRFEWALICCAMRNFSRGMGSYYDNLLDVLPRMRRKEVVAVASLEAVRAAVTARERYGVPVTGFDLAGEEAGYPAGHHYRAYEEAHRHFMRKTVHAGEAYGAESIYEAIARCHAERIGHGTLIFAADRVRDPQIADPQGFVEQLAEYIATMRITVEVCPTSNLQTMPELEGSMRNHPVKQMLECGMAVAIGTDNTLVSNTDINRELELVTTACNLNMKSLKRLVLAGFKGSFYPGRYAEKRNFVRSAAERIEKLIKMR